MRGNKPSKSFLPLRKNPSLYLDQELAKHFRAGVLSRGRLSGMKDGQVWKAYTPELQVQLSNERGEIGPEYKLHA